MSRYDDRQKAIADFRSQVFIHRAGIGPDHGRPIPTDAAHDALYADVSLAIGILLGEGYPGGAAAVTVIAEQIFPGIVDAYVASDPEKS